MAETIVYKPAGVEPILSASLTACCVLGATLLWFLSPWAAMFLVILGTLVLMSRLPLRTAVIVFILIMPFDPQRQIGGVWVLLDSLFAAIALPLIRFRKRPPALCGLLIPFFIYFVLTGFPRSLVPAYFLRYAFRWVVALSFSAAVALSGPGEGLILAAGVTLIPLTAYAVYQLLVGGLGDLFLWMNPIRYESDMPWQGRSYSLMWWPNFYAEFSGMIGIMMLVLGFKGYKPKLTLPLGGLGILGLLCSGSRGADLGFGLAFIVLLSQTPRFWRKLVAISAIALVIWGAQQYYNILPVQRAEQLDEFTAESRILIWGAAYTVWQEHPIVGVGTANFREVMLNIINFPSAVHAHSTYLQILSETGLIGFALFYGPLIYLLWRAWKSRTNRVALAAACALLVWLTQGAADITFMDNPPSTFLLFTVIGLLVNGLTAATVLASPESGNIASH